jgi:amidohydrolase
MAQTIIDTNNVSVHQLKLEAEQLRETLVSIRRRIHAQPEYGFQEFETAALIAETLEGLGVRVRRGVATTGLVGEIGDGPLVVAIRADMDALPIDESTALPFASKVPRMMHACGHDAHVACALGAAMLLAKKRIPGTIRLLFQPSEEQKGADGRSGAMRMVDERVLDDVSAVLALHTKALPVGSIGVTSGPALAASDYFKVLIRGKAAHGAHPEEGIDTIAITSLIIAAIQQIVARRLPAISPAVVSVTTIRGGIKENIIAEQVELRGTIRSAGGEVRTRIIAELDRALDVGRVLGATCDMTLSEGYPVTVNDRQVTDVIRIAAGELLGEQKVVVMPFDTWAEDFGYMTGKIPGAMFWLGVTSPRVPLPVWHSSSFDLDEDCLPVGAAVLAAAALRLLESF